MIPVKITYTNIEVKGKIETIDLLYERIKLRCDIPSQNLTIIESFKFSNRWQRHLLKVGDQVIFNAVLKTMHDMTVSIETGELDEYNELPIELTDTKDIHEVIRPSKIAKMIL